MEYSRLKGLLTPEECAALESVAAKLEKAGWESRDYEEEKIMDLDGYLDHLDEYLGRITGRYQYDQEIGPLTKQEYELQVKMDAWLEEQGQAYLAEIQRGLNAHNSSLAENVRLLNSTWSREFSR